MSRRTFPCYILEWLALELCLLVYLDARAHRCSTRHLYKMAGQLTAPAVISADYHSSSARR